MNKRIKELADEATRKYDRLGFEIPFAQPDLELFAKLIIRECVDFTNTYHVNGKSIVGQVIKEHFGVE